MKNVLRMIVLAAALTVGATGFAYADEICRASWYGPGFHGNTMANGQQFNQNDVSVVAHKSYKFGTRLLVTNLDNGKAIEVVVQDRGPYHRGRCVDLSKAGAKKLDFIGAGTARVRVQQL